MMGVLNPDCLLFNPFCLRQDVFLNKTFLVLKDSEACPPEADWTEAAQQGEPRLQAGATSTQYQPAG
ncbi:MAG: hypothetical protein A3E37_02005 [Candidatus Andersenbacteria bacterium RIFCSPHIGHO2_12_FULL_46_9]|nr:MAG: hypothetical protein A3B76_01510 [Candidatus Andersenbacteria bacterium RIFCSPHIGHO2_02_FULL_46_16]OGY36035.1 MAG: hypothetical protein A3I08_02905 [Candidatus Andersenbacteria bacterium RIFCSPLOWO2_02_FULL_46_11]OGY36807.1 MAG: hypothetical protein A3E37_02005 [Candidatus Andersenbacteria bacterium RIFCSPHIGHO2_12_FULL_46_9]HBE89985.1 hypothetical protein [Candidatus Andersenbacteria bacterium]